MRCSLSMMILVVGLAACGGKKSDEDKRETPRTTRDAPGESPTAGKLDAKKVAEVRQAKLATTEARKHVRQLFDAARMYYMDTPATGMKPTPAQIPYGSVGPTPPKGECCKGQDGTCAPTASSWVDPVWQALYFSMTEPHRYSYEYKGDENGLTVRAFGDLDCDGTFSTFEMSATSEALAGGGEPSLLKSSNPLE